MSELYRPTFGKLDDFSSTSTNSTSLAYKCGLRNVRFDISESLKCFGGLDLLRSKNCRSLAWSHYCQLYIVYEIQLFSLPLAQYYKVVS